MLGNAGDEPLDVSGWVIDSLTQADHEFLEGTVLDPDETIEVTDDIGLVNYEGGSGSLTVRNGEGSVVLEREILHDERASHIGIVRSLDQNGDPVEGEAVTFYSEGSGEEVLESAPSRGDRPRRDAGLRYHSGTSVIEFLVSGDSDSDEDNAAGNGS